jgi:hypothetical protein
MNSQIFIMSGILPASLLLSTIPSEFLTSPALSAFGQQVTFQSVDKNTEGSLLDTTINDNNNNMKDYNIVPVSIITTDTNDSSVSNSSNMNETIPMMTVVDINNSTYIAPKDVNENQSERRISRGIRDRINDIAHTVVMSNATIISTATVTNNLIDESITTNNYTRLVEIIPEQVEIALTLIRETPQPANTTIELHTDVETVCSADNDTLAECDMNIRIR